MTAHALKTLSSSSATRLTPNGIHSGMDITIQNVDAAAYVYIGSDEVTAVNYGFRLAPGAAFSIELPGKDPLYAITDVNNSKVAVLQTNLESGN
jgi:predicted nucleic acid-binding Zn finger protein